MVAADLHLRPPRALLLEAVDVTARGRRRGYEAEAAIAKYLGMERIGGSGKRDVDGEWLCAEIKERQEKTQWLLGMVQQAVRLAKPGQLPIGVIHFLKQNHDDDLVVMRLKDFRDYFGGGKDD